MKTAETQKTNRKFKYTHRSCPKCEHKGCFAINEDWSAVCFSCNYTTNDLRKDFPDVDTIISRTGYSKRKGGGNIPPKITVDRGAGIFGPLLDRGISEATAKRYGVRILAGSDGKPTQHYYPYFIANEAVAHKVRHVNDKIFTWVGPATDTGLFGQQFAQAGGKYITITEGECDAMAAYELLGSKWPVVSIKSGAGGAVKDVKESLEFLETFENIVIAFDADKPGKEAARKVARLLRPGAAKIMTFPEGYKDPNDMLRQNQQKLFMRSFWEAQTYTPSGVINVTEFIKDKYHNRPKKESVPYPWTGLNKKLYGLRQGELVSLTGGTGLGKTSVTRELEHWLIKSTQDNVGIIALEENEYHTVDGLLSIEANARLYIDQIREQYSREEIDKYLEILHKGENENRVYIHSHFGTNDVEEIFAKLRYFIIGLECKWIVFDHISMLVSAIAEGDERRTIDNVMTRLRSLVEETGAGIILVSHLRRVDGNKGHENGIEVSLSHLRGSQSIAQLSDCVIALERNQQAEDSVEANTTRVRVLKSRYTGDTGIATHLIYDRDTGRLSELDGMESEEPLVDF
jgi:twinkle protein